MIERIKPILEEKKLDAILLTDQYSIRYLTGYTGDTGCLYVSRHKRVILTDCRYTTQARQETEGIEVVEVKIGKDYAEEIKRLLDEDQAAAAGYQEHIMVCSEYQRFCEVCAGISWIPLGDEVSRLRMIKQDWEIEYTAKAQSIADQAFSYMVSHVLKPGITEQDVALELEYYMRKHGADSLSFDVIAAAGLNSAMPHAIPSAKKLESGDFLTMDFGCKYGGYCSDMTRTVVIGKANERQKEIYQIVLEAQLTGLAAVKEGISGRDADKAARAVIEKAGYGEYFGHSLGHGTGLEIHESPRLSAGDQTILKENMLVTVEPGIYIPGFGGVRIEDMVAVTKEGCRNLASSPKELIEI